MLAPRVLSCLPILSLGAVPLAVPPVVPLARPASLPAGGGASTVTGLEVAAAADAAGARHWGQARVGLPVSPRLRQVDPKLEDTLESDSTKAASQGLLRLRGETIGDSSMLDLSAQRAEAMPSSGFLGTWKRPLGACVLAALAAAAAVSRLWQARAPKVPVVQTEMVSHASLLTPAQHMPGLVAFATEQGCAGRRCAFASGGEHVASVARKTGVTAMAAVGPDDVNPLSSYCLVRPKEVESVTKGGILLSTGSKDKPNEGEVLAVGPGRLNEYTGVRMPVGVEVGKNIVYSPYGSEKVVLGEDEYVLVRDEDILLSFEGCEATLDNLKMPLGKILVRLHAEIKETAGGLVLSKGASKPDTDVGDVIAVADGVRGPDGKVHPLDVAVGDTVRFRYGNEVKLEVGNNEYRAIDVEDCLAKWNA